MPARVALADFALRNPLYGGATVTVFRVTAALERTTDLATVYSAPSGPALASNPQRLDSEGKWTSPVYVAEPVIMVVGSDIFDAHETGVVTAGGRWRGDWQAGTVYQPDDMARFASDIYVCVAAHTAGVFAADFASAKWEVFVEALASAEDAANSAAAASLSASSASSSATAAANSANAAADSATAAAAGGVKVTASDTTASPLASALVAGTGINLAVQSPGANETLQVSLANTGVTAGNYGGASAVPTFTVDAQGRLTAAGAVAITAGLTNWTESVNTSSPNATVPVVRLLATNAATDVDAAITPKGTGALLAQVPDGTTTGGNKRGSQSTDFQQNRSAATQVASGARAVVAGGLNNTASAANAFVGGGASNTATGVNAVVAGGSENLASGYTSWIPGGYRATTRGLQRGSVASGFFATTGDAQWGLMVLRRQTTDFTPTVLTSDGYAPGTNNQIVLPNDCTCFFRIEVAARRTDGDNGSAAYVFTGCVDRNTTAASTALVGTVTKTVLAEDVAAWDVNVTADTTNGSVAITVNGEGSTNINWVAVAYLVEVVG
jgi:hypothetical protein